MIPKARIKQTRIRNEPIRNGRGRKAVERIPAMIGPKIFPMLTYEALRPRIEP